RAAPPRSSPGTGLVSSLVHQVGAAVLGPGRFVGAGCTRPLLAEAYRFHLRFLHAQCGERPAHGLGALLAESEVVLAAAAFVGVALDQHAAIAVAVQVAR